MYVNILVFTFIIIISLAKQVNYFTKIHYYTHDQLFNIYFLFGKPYLLIH